MVTLEPIEHFHARGMRRLHGFDVYTGARRRKFQCDIWRDKEDCLLVRFHCPTESDYDESYRLVGLSVSDLSRADLDKAEIEGDLWPAWVPQCIRERWDLWFTSVI
jgi:hypothetical protein